MPRAADATNQMPDENVWSHYVDRRSVDMALVKTKNTMYEMVQATAENNADGVVKG